METVLINVLGSGALVAITTTPVDPGSYQVSELPALSTAVTAGSRPLTAGKDQHTTDKSIAGRRAHNPTHPGGCSRRCSYLLCMEITYWRWQPPLRG
nr:MAG TPA: hypothetical protein [Caudoviricetes sp.]